MSGSIESPSLHSGGGAEAARQRLRGMMAVGGEAGPALAEASDQPGRDAYAKLRDTAWTGRLALFQTALADAANISFAEASPLALSTRRRSLLLVLRGLGLTPEQAFLVVSALDPTAHPHAEAVRLFYENFRLLHPEAGLDEIRRLRAESVATMINRQPAPRKEDAEVQKGMLKAS